MENFKKKAKVIRSRFYSWLGIKRYRLAQRPKPVLPLADLLGEADGKEPPVNNLNLRSLFQKYNVTPVGVIHVGAHEAGELEEYLAMGFSTVLYVEANPDLIPRLKEKAASCTGARVIIAHAAVTDHNGAIALRVTSMDQSSSILPLGIHKNIYPSIRECNQVEVPARTLDHLLFELGLSPERFNFLNLDIQGAELLALKGASRLLSHIEAIVSEVNLVELYKGAALLPQLEEHLRAAGFNRAAMSTPWHPTWGDAFFVKRPVVTMSSLGKNGRFGNQLFQYLYLRLVAERQGAIVQTPDWAGRTLFGLEDPEPVSNFPLVYEATGMQPPPHSIIVSDAAALFEQQSCIFPNIDLYGWFQLNPQKYRNIITKIFTPVKPLRDFWGRVLSNMCGDNRKVIAIHLRRGDYGYSSFLRAPCRWYEAWVQGELFDPKSYIIYIASETPEIYRNRFKGFDVFTSLDAGCSAELALYFDFFVMSRASKIAISNSTFSFFASMINCNSDAFFRPCGDVQALIPYSPWRDPVFINKEYSVDQHNEFASMD
jgi:FkbM family methyltransferase